MPKSSRARSGTYRRLLKTTATYWIIFLLGIVGTVLMSSVDASFAWLIKPIINKGFISRDVFFVQWLPLIVILIFIVRGVACFASNYFISRVARSVVMDFRQALFRHLLKLPAAFYDRTNSGHLIATIIYNVEQVAQASTDALISILREGSLLIGLVVVMFVISWQLSLIILLITPVVAWVINKSSVRIRRLSSNVQQSVSEVTHISNEGVDAYKVIRLFGGQSYEYDKFVKATSANRHRELKVIVTNAISSSFVQVLIALPIAVILFFAINPHFGVTAGSFAAVASSMVMLARPLRRMTLVNSMIQKGIAAVESIFSLLDEPVEPDMGQLKLDRCRGEIEFKHVCFNYEGSSRAVLQDINFVIKPGQTVAIVGRSGSGKSTLINLLPRFYEHQRGSILIDGVDIREYCLSELRQQFSLVAQETALFNDTVARNIAYARQGATEAEIIAAAKTANVMEFINRLPQGLDTLIGENGVLLSGGQRQRIAIARALFKQAPILILDEATASLDTHAEREIQAALDMLMARCTTLVIAHRLSTIENADWIMVMDAGRIVETGTHQQLLARDGAYAALYRMQFGDGKVPRLAEA